MKSIPSVSGYADHRMVVGKLRMERPRPFKLKARKGFKVKKYEGSSLQRNFQSLKKEVAANEDWRTLREVIIGVSEKIVKVKNTNGKK